MTTAARAYRKLAVIAVLALFWPSLGEAAEQACGNLGANCVCSRTLAATSWVEEPAAGFPGAFYEANQNTSDSKLCGFIVNGRKLLYSTLGAPQVTTGLRGLPALRVTGGTGVFNVEPSEAVKNTFTGRVGMRYYTTHTGDYQTANEAACSNDKYTQLGDYLDASLGAFRNSADGRNFTPGADPADLKGKWYRIEHYLDSYANPTTHTIYLKNITDGTPEKVMTVPARLALTREFLTGFTHIIHHYRATLSGGTCTGSATFMYAMLAHWPTPAGQRIGPAVEIEGGATADGPPAEADGPPAAPTGVTVR